MSPNILAGHILHQLPKLKPGQGSHCPTPAPVAPDGCPESDVRPSLAEVGLPPASAGQQDGAGAVCASQPNAISLCGCSLTYGGAYPRKPILE